MPLPTHAVAKATKNDLVTYRNHCSEPGDRTYKLRANEPENYDSLQPHLPTTMDIKYSYWWGSFSKIQGWRHESSLHYRCSHNAPYAGYVSEYISTFLFPQESDHGAGWLWHLGEGTHPNKLPNPGLKYNWAYISDHKLYWWVGVTLKKKRQKIPAGRNWKNNLFQQLH